MTTLETTYAGLKLRNPIIVGSSGLTNSADKNRRLYEAGAGAVVLKSLFEEQILMDADSLSNPQMAPEGSDYLLNYVRMHKLGEYLELIRETKKACPIPVIASINCYDDSNWVDFARQIEEADPPVVVIRVVLFIGQGRGLGRVQHVLRGADPLQHVVRLGPCVPVEQQVLPVEV